MSVSLKLVSCHVPMLPTGLMKSVQGQRCEDEVGRETRLPATSWTAGMLTMHDANVVCADLHIAATNWQ
jgi:hypothetical protein